jgi:plastocyanin
MRSSRLGTSVVAIAPIGLLLFASAGCSSSPKASCSEPRATTTVSIADMRFSPGCVAASSTATLTIENDDSLPHTFTIQGTGTDVSIDPGKTASVPLSGLAPGIYPVICRFHPQMVEDLRIA